MADFFLPFEISRLATLARDDTVIASCLTCHCVHSYLSFRASVASREISYAIASNKYCAYICTNFCSMQVVTISGFRANIKQYYDNVLLTEEPLIITKGDNGAVLIPLKEFNSLQRRLEFYKNTQAVRDLKEAVDQMASGKLIEVTDIDAL